MPQPEMTPLQTPFDKAVFRGDWRVLKLPQMGHHVALTALVHVVGTPLRKDDFSG